MVGVFVCFYTVFLLSNTEATFLVLYYSVHIQTHDIFDIPYH